MSLVDNLDCSGKSFITRKLIAFFVVFYTHHYKLGIHDRFFLTYTSFKKENIEGQLDKLLPEVRKAIECYNELYPSMYIEWAETPKELKIEKGLLKNTSVIQFNRVKNKESFPYSQIDIVSLNSKVISSGITSHAIVLEESQDLNYDWVSKIAIPFLGSTSGICIAIGTANSSPESALYNYYKSDSIPKENKIVYTWEEIYRLKKYVSQEHADTYKKLVESEISERGIRSRLIQTEWYCNFNLTDDKFTSVEFLEENNILTEDLESNISHYKNKDIYRIATFDGAIKKDRASLCLGISKLNGKNIEYAKIKEFEVIKEAGVNANPRDLIRKVVNICISNSLDYLMVDNTSNMEYLTIPIYEELKARKCNTQLIAFSFSGAREKVKMFSFFESVLYEQTIKFPKLENRDLSKGFEYFIEEICQLKAHKTSRGEYTYKALEGADFYDDFAMAGAMFSYSMRYLLDCISENKQVKIGDIIYRLYLRKNEVYNQEEKPKLKFWDKTLAW